MAGRRSRDVSRAVNAEDEKVAEAILAAIRNIRYGTVEIIVQDSKVIQVNTTEKVRLDRPQGEQHGAR